MAGQQDSGGAMLARPGSVAANSKAEGLRVLLILSALLAFASISTDLYLPAMPAMAAALHADGGTLALTISGYLAGFSLGQLLQWQGWHAVFWVLVLVGLGTVASLRWLPETLPAERRAPASPRAVLGRYAALVRNPRFMAYVAAGGFFYAGTFAYIAGSPFAYIGWYHVSPQGYGLLFGAGIAGMMLTNQINARLVGRYGSDRLLAGAVVLRARHP